MSDETLSEIVAPQEMSDILWLTKFGQTASHNVGFARLLQPGLCIDKLNESFIAIASRHDALRTSFVLDDKVKRRIRSKLDDPSLSVTSSPHKSLHLTTEFQSILDSRFSINDQILWRAALIRCTDGDVLTFTINHALCDEYSLRLIMNDLNETYMEGHKYEESERTKNKLEDYWRARAAVWSDQNIRTKANYLLKYRESFLKTLQKPAMYLDAGTEPMPATLVRINLLDDNENDILLGFSKECGCSSYFTRTYLAAITATYLLGIKRTIVPAMYSGRLSRESESIVGRFAHQLPIFIDLGATGTAAEVFRHAYNEWLNAQRHLSGIPLGMLHGHLDNTTGPKEEINSLNLATVATPPRNKRAGHFLGRKYTTLKFPRVDYLTYNRIHVIIDPMPPYQIKVRIRTMHRDLIADLLPRIRATLRDLLSNHESAFIAIFDKNTDL